MTTTLQYQYARAGLPDSRDKHEPGLDRTELRSEANFGQIRTGSDCYFFENWRIKTGSDWEHFCCVNVIIVPASKNFVVM